jgi:hypothetical protein
MACWTGGGGCRLRRRWFVDTHRKQLTMSTSSCADRINLYWLMQQHPDWTQAEYAEALHRSKSWVGKWQGRLRSSHLTIIWMSLSPNLCQSQFMRQQIEEQTFSSSSNCWRIYGSEMANLWYF